MTARVRTTDDDFLVQKMMRRSCIKRIIDWKTLGITNEYIEQQSKLSLTWNNEDLKFIDNRVRPDIDDQEAMDRFYVTEMCLPYNPKPDDEDLFAYYNDLGPLCGSAGYLRIRDGYVYGQKVVIRA